MVSVKHSVHKRIAHEVIEFEVASTSPHEALLGRPKLDVRLLGSSRQLLHLFQYKTGLCV